MNLERIIEWEKQFSSVELSKKLKELGVTENTCFNWVYNKDQEKWSIFANSPISKHLTWDDKVPAYSASELLELLPSNRIYNKKYLNSKLWGCKDSYRYAPIFKDISLPNSCAKMLIYLIENNLINHPKE